MRSSLGARFIAAASHPSLVRWRGLQASQGHHRDTETQRRKSMRRARTASILLLCVSVSLWSIYLAEAQAPAPHRASVPRAPTARPPPTSDPHIGKLTLPLRYGRPLTPTPPSPQPRRNIRERNCF